MEKKFFQRISFGKRKCEMTKCVNSKDNVCNDNDQNESRPALIRRQVVHYKQRFDWDCGISCVLMALSRQQRQQFLMNFNKICDSEGFGKCTWTIDLCYLLLRYKIKHNYYTITMGINPEHISHRYYSDVLTRDYERITTKFTAAAKNGVIVERKSIQTEEMLEHLAKYGPIIALTNANLLQCEICNSYSRNFLSVCFAKKVRTDYCGHYIIICGYDDRISSFLYMNPTHTNRVCAMSYQKMHDARIADGTDEDLILIFSD